MAQPPPIAAPQEHRFPCDQCGADYRFSPDQSSLVCDHCGNTAPLEGGGSHHAPIRELDFRAALEARLPDVETQDVRTLRCPNCAAQIEFADNSHATECPFCATPVVTDTGVTRHIKPKAVLPFGLDEHTAREALGDWLGGLWFAPNGVKEYARKGRKLQGVYVPYWTYDADTKIRYSGERGTVYYETRSVNRNGKTAHRRVQKVRWTPASGKLARFFDDVLVLASRSLPKRYTDALEPWDLSELEPYRPEYLAGFHAEGYTVEIADGYTQARAYMDRVIERDVKFAIGGDRQRIANIDTKISDVTFKHILLPVWMAAYKYRGKSYRFVVNGRTGRVQGERPYSIWKITFAVIIAALIAGAIGFASANAQ